MLAKSILLITNYKPGCGGISVQVELIQKRLRGEGLIVDVFNTKKSLIKRLGLFGKLKKVGQQYDIFHIHTCSGFGFFSAVIGIVVGRLLKKKIILTYHGGGAERFFDRHHSFVHYFLTKTDVNIVLSGFLSRIFNKHSIPCIIIPNAIEFDSSHYRRRVHFAPRFISIRTLSSLYNIECLLNGFKKVKDVIPGATLTIVGDGPSRKSLEQMVKDEGIRDVAFIGRVDNSIIYQYLGDADIMVSTPRIDNMPVSILEAMNAGLLVISSNVGGVPYMIEDGDTGLLFENDNHQQLAEKMIWAVEHQEDVSNMADTAKEKLSYYSWESVRDKLLNVYSMV